ncbi:MAG: hypothetical protein ACOC22_02250 [bacterium]
MKKIIMEELESLLNETNDFTDENLRFQQIIQNVNYLNYDTFSTEHDSNIVDSNIAINWKIGFKLNEFGVENFIINVEKLQGWFTLSLRDKQSDETLQDSKKNITDFNWNYKIDNAALIKGGSLYVKELIFDFENNTCIVKF